MKQIPKGKINRGYSVRTYSDEDIKDFLELDDKESQEMNVKNGLAFSSFLSKQGKPGLSG